MHHGFWIVEFADPLNFWAMVERTAEPLMIESEKTRIVCQHDSHGLQSAVRV